MKWSCQLRQELLTSAGIKLLLLGFGPVGCRFPTSSCSCGTIHRKQLHPHTARVRVLPKSIQPDTTSHLLPAARERHIAHHTGVGETHGHKRIQWTKFIGPTWDPPGLNKWTYWLAGLGKVWVCSVQLAEAATAAAGPQQLSSHAYFTGINKRHTNEATAVLN